MKDGVGGWGVLILYPDGSKHEMSGAFDTSPTNNQMELWACIEALNYIHSTENPEEVEVTLVSDSEYVVNGYMKWLPGWIRKKWKTTTGPVKNQPLWEALHEVASKLKIKFTWVRGHTGEEHNERVDKLAGEAYRALIK